MRGFNYSKGQLYSRYGWRNVRRKSVEDYEWELTGQTSEMPQHLAFCIDYEKMGRDMEISGDIFTVETAYREVHIFWNHQG